MNRGKGRAIGGTGGAGYREGRPACRLPGRVQRALWPRGQPRRRCYDACMKRTTISQPDELALALEREARRRGESVSALTRQVLAERFGLAGGARRLPIRNLGRSGRSDTSARIEELLAAEWRDDRDR